MLSFKQFLKLDWRKIVIMFIFFIFFIYLEINCSARYVVALIDSYEGSSRKGSWEYPCGSLSKTMLSLESIYVYLGITLYNPIVLFLHLLVSYLLSCFIVWIYNNFRKVKKK